MEQVVDFSKDLDISLLDHTIDLFYGGKGTAAERKQAEEVLKKVCFLKQ